MPDTGIDIAVVVTCIIALGSAAGIIWKVIKPALALIKRVDELDERSKRDYEARVKQVEYNRATAMALHAVVAHTAKGNHTGEMEQALIELQNFLMGFKSE